MTTMADLDIEPDEPTAEDRAAKEIPVFLVLTAVRL